MYFVAIGQKASSVAAIVDTLRQHGALDYTVVVAATASDSASMRYYAPFAGVAIGEYIRDTGRDALIIYDDLSKQAVANREIPTAVCLNVPLKSLTTSRWQRI